MTFIPTDDGRWVSEKYARLAEIIQDYDPQFELRWIPPEHRAKPTYTSRCYVIWDIITNSAVLYAGDLDSPETILERLFDADNKHGNVLDRVEAHNAAIEAFNLKEQMDIREEQMDKVSWLIGTKKNFIEMGKNKIYDDQLRRIR